MFLALPTPRERNALYDRILSQPHVHLRETNQQEATLRWQTGDMTNYEYLMLLNVYVHMRWLRVCLKARSQV